MTAVPPRSSSKLIVDTAGIEEAISFADSRYCAVPFNEKHILEMCSNIDNLLGRSDLPGTFAEISYDKTRECYIGVIHALERDSGLNEDLHWLLLYMVQNKHKIKKQPKDVYELYKLILGWARYCPFEPKWHMARRGDSKRLPNKRPFNMWSYLLNLYTDPHESIRRTPDWVVRKWNDYPGYKNCVNKAIEDGHAWLLKAYGPDVDLTPRTDPVIQQSLQSNFSRDAFLDGSLLDSIRNV